MPNYIQRIRDRGGLEKFRAELEQGELRRLLAAWQMARESVKAQFMAEVGLAAAGEVAGLAEAIEASLSEIQASYVEKKKDCSGQ